MNLSPDKQWSTAMRIALVGLSLVGAFVFVASIVMAVHAWKANGTVEVELIVRAVGGAVWGALTLLLLKHPEWKRAWNRSSSLIHNDSKPKSLERTRDPAGQRTRTGL